MKALNLYLDCGEREMDRAIEVVGKARSDMLTHTLIDFLMGERDGEPKDPNYIYRLYVSLGNYEQAASTSILIARQERELQALGVALSSTTRTCIRTSICAPPSLSQLALLDCGRHGRRRRPVDVDAVQLDILGHRGMRPELRVGESGVRWAGCLRGRASV